MLKQIAKHSKQGTLLDAAFRPLIIPCYETFLTLRGKMIDDPDQAVYVPADLIEHALTGQILPRHYNLGFTKQRMVGLLEKGNWDMITKRFDEIPAYTICKERFIESKEWEETGYYQLFNERLKREGTVRMCKNWPEFKEQKLKYWDTLYNRIKKNGYEKRNNPRKEIEVAVSRQGVILFEDGAHRLAMVKILNIKEIPVIVNHWHNDFIDQVKSYTGKKKITPSEAIKFVGEGYKLLIGHST